MDLRTGELRRSGAMSQKLSDQPFQILAMLLMHAGDLVTREEIRKSLWPNGTIVEFEHSINAAMNRLRLALGDSADDPHFIETFARRGYRWKTPVEWIEDQAEPQTKPQPPANGNWIGKKVSHYRVLEILGGGGMGVVYKAEDLKLGRRVALKFLPEEMASDPAAMQRFEREARAASALNHPNICTIYEVEEHEGQPFIVMELLEGRTLRELIPVESNSNAKESPFAVPALIDIAIQIAAGLEAAHSKGIVHRDIKPANIFVTASSHVKILDFGLAKLQEVETSLQEHVPSGAPPSKEVWSPYLTLTRTGTPIGTAGYMSPEQIRCEKVDARTDLFSFGLVLYEMTTCRRAFPEPTAPSLQDAILNRTPTPPSNVNPDLPIGLVKIINKAMEKDLDLRYQSAAQMLDDLRRMKDIRRSTEIGVFPRILLTVREALTKNRRHVSGFCGVVILTLAGIALARYFRHPRPTSLTDQDTIVLSDFANTTGDSLFDGTLRQALALQLQQSPFLNPLSDDKMIATLKLMDLRPSARLTQEVATEICLRTNSKALLAGSISNRGSAYTVTLKALNCDTGAVLGSAHAEANGRQDVLKALDESTNSMRQRLGESLASVQRFNKPLDEATTSSLEALKSFTQGQALLRDKGSAEAIPYFKRSVALDPNFAYAHAALAMAYGNLKEFGKANEHSRKAYELKDRVGQRERFYIEADLARNEEMQKYVDIFLQWIQTYPRDALPHLNLGNTYASLGQAEKAAEQTRIYLQLKPDSQLGYANLIEQYLFLNRFDEAKATSEQAQALKLDGFYLRMARYSLGFVSHDEEMMKEQLAWAMGKPGSEDAMLSDQSDSYGYYGRIHEARDFSQRAINSAKLADANQAAAIWQVNAALREAEFGNLVFARQAVSNALALSTDSDTEVLSALALARIGDDARALKLAKKISQQYPRDTMWRAYWLPTIRASIELRAGDLRKAIELLNASVEYDLGETETFLTGPMYPTYVRGIAYLKMHEGLSAAAEFQRIIDHRGLVQNFPLGALAHLQLARALLMNGYTLRAKATYQDFFALWKDADPDIPIFISAKAEYAKLK